VVRFGEHELPLPASDLASSAERRVVFGVRPTDFELVGPHVDPSWPRISVVADVVEQLGAESHVQFTLDAPRMVAEAIQAAADTRVEGEDRLLADDERARFVARITGRHVVPPGTRIELAVDHHHLHFFDLQSGDALDQPSPSTARALSR
jgi:multiple sugar transport system ATP-binding protein